MLESIPAVCVTIFENFSSIRTCKPRLVTQQPGRAGFLQFLVFKFYFTKMRLIFLLATVQCQIYKGMRAADHAKITKGPSQFGKLRTRGPTLPPPVEESQIFGAWIEGKRDSTKWVS